jgi:hypothetical protein
LLLLLKRHDGGGGLGPIHAVHGDGKALGDKTLLEDNDVWP